MNMVNSTGSPLRFAVGTKWILLAEPLRQNSPLVVVSTRCGSVASLASVSIVKMAFTANAFHACTQKSTPYPVLRNPCRNSTAGAWGVDVSSLTSRLESMGLGLVDCRQDTGHTGSARCTLGRQRILSHMHRSTRRALQRLDEPAHRHRSSVCHRGYQTQCLPSHLQLMDR